MDWLLSLRYVPLPVRRPRAPEIDTGRDWTRNFWDVQFPPLGQGAARQTFASSSVIRLRKASCAILRATAPANAPAAAATSGLVWNSETPWVPTSTARIAPDSAIDEKPRNQVTNLETAASWSAGLGLRALICLSEARLSRTSGPGPTETSPAAMLSRSERCTGATTLSLSTVLYPSPEKKYASSPCSMPCGTSATFCRPR